MPVRGPAGRRFLRMMCATVLLSEALVVLFFLLVAKNSDGVPDGALFGLGGAVILACLLLTGLLRYTWAYRAGWVLQAAMIASGFLVPTMFFLGAVFAALWAGAFVAAARIERAAPAAG